MNYSDLLESSINSSTKRIMLMINNLILSSNKDYRNKSINIKEGIIETNNLINNNTESHLDVCLIQLLNKRATKLELNILESIKSLQRYINQLKIIRKRIKELSNNNLDNKNINSISKSISKNENITQKNTITQTGINNLLYKEIINLQTEPIKFYEWILIPEFN
ncbi:uncharacterized protein CMU_005280 [Cryptosporidium muris RN66]|uniref:Uncharacterized protein n=1 Tax=Cryptosporidium muris (strain RN66) TaxID=441375 RepID=B6AHB0_CRYMR|nr:uncharacterized protein CMU_005280 [Cryptosporidium muris RN66]EEA07605.1 hypothetical protein, conserved [Cryptosporidium muris RN66]|eukprot:XP_002141954.1 hypothetical protein [Cryptosporidium muris RN66]